MMVERYPNLKEEVSESIPGLWNLIFFMMENLSGGQLSHVLWHWHVWFCLKWRKNLDKEGKRERRLRCCCRRELWCCFSFQVGLSRYVLIPETVMTYIQGQLLQAECFSVIGKKDPRCRGVLWIRACLRVDLHSRKVVPLRALLSIELSREFL